MEEAQAFLEAMADAPDDDAPRLVYSASATPASSACSLTPDEVRDLKARYGDRVRGGKG
jgi:hypothetical protein